MSATDYKASEEKTKSLYQDDYSRHYRQYDEQFINEPDFIHYRERISSLSGSFTYPISVLEIGCGTGRYFHILKHTKDLTGIDVSASMLDMAKNPLKGELVNIPDIKLIVGNIYDHDFGNKKFDFIMSTGVLGEHAPFTPELCNKLYTLLNNNGILYTTIVDLESRKNLKRKLAEMVYPLLPLPVKRIFDKRWVSNYMTPTQLRQLMDATMFKKYEISVNKSVDSKWKGQHLEVVAYRTSN